MEIARHGMMSPMRHHVRVVAALLVTATLAVGLAACTRDPDVTGLPSELPPADGATTTVPLPVAAPPCVQTPNGVGQDPPPGSRPGDLIASYELDGQYKSSVGFPTDAHAWRISYVSTGLDEHDLQIVCGMAAAPAKGPSTFTVDSGPVGRMLAWAHGTSGLQQACLPSLAPDTSLWGKMSDGINAISWGSGFGARKGDPANGALQTALDRGWVVSAADYQPNDTYVVGRIAAANVIDAARATSQLMDQQHPGEAPDAYDTITWGHSQGGHAAVWAGQMMDSYQEAAPNHDAATLRLAGVAALAPAANFIVQPDRQGIEAGNGLADWEMHHTIEMLGLPLPALELQIAPPLFSYIFGSWAVLSGRGTPADDATTPAFPRDAGVLDLRAVTTAEGAETVAQLAALCTVTDARKVQSIAAPYRDAARHMLVPELWNLPDAYSPGEFFQGRRRPGVRGARPGAQRRRRPGRLVPLDPLEPARTRRGQPVPEGPEQDGMSAHAHRPGDGTTGHPQRQPTGRGRGRARSRRLPERRPVRVATRTADDGYCPATGDRGHLELALYRKDPGSASPAGHLPIPVRISAAGGSKAADHSPDHRWGSS